MWAGPGRDRERCICIMTPSGYGSGCYLELCSSEMLVQVANRKQVRQMDVDKEIVGIVVLVLLARRKTGKAGAAGLLAGGSEIRDNR